MVDGNYKISAYKTAPKTWNFFGTTVTTQEVAEEPYTEMVVPIAGDAYGGTPINQIVKIDFMLPTVFRGTLGSDVIVGVRQRTEGDYNW